MTLLLGSFSEDPHEGLTKVDLDAMRSLSLVPDPPAEVHEHGEPRDIVTDEALEWFERGACRGLDADLFFPERGESTKEAKVVCAACPVKPECLEYALANSERFGIWGGTSERERRRMRRDRNVGKRTPPKCGTRSSYVAGCAVNGVGCAACREANNAHNRRYRAMS